MDSERTVAQKTYLFQSILWYSKPLTIANFLFIFWVSMSTSQSDNQSVINRRIEERTHTHFPGFAINDGFQTPIKVVDISAHGIGFFCNERLQAGDIIEIELSKNEIKTYQPFCIEVEIRNRFIHEQSDRYGAKVLSAPEVYYDFLPNRKPIKSKLASTLNSIFSH